MRIGDGKEVWEFEMLGEGGEEIGGVWGGVGMGEDEVGVWGNM